MAFMSAWTPAPTTGRTAWTAGTASVVRGRPSAAAAAGAPTMRFGVDMNKYSRMSSGAGAMDKYARMSGFSPGSMSAGSRLAAEGTWTQYMSKLISMRQFPQGRGTSAMTGVKARDGPKADAYVAECVRSQYKQQANPAGVVRFVAGLGRACFSPCRSA